MEERKVWQIGTCLPAQLGYIISISTLLAYLDIILCLKVVGFILHIEWIEPFKEGMIQSKSDVGFTSNGSC
jgi:hypothetical protein